MKPEYYYVYCNGILGVKTNIQNFKWVYGSVAPAESAEAYEKCAVKFHVWIKPEKELDEIDSYSKKFQAFCWSEEHRTIYYRRAFLSRLKSAITSDSKTMLWKHRLAKDTLNWFRIEP